MNDVNISLHCNKRNLNVKEKIDLLLLPLQLTD